MPTHVLLVEDNPGDVQLTQEAFREANVYIQLHVVTDGVEAMKLLKREGTPTRASPRSYPAGSELATNGRAARSCSRSKRMQTCKRFQS